MKQSKAHIFEVIKELGRAKLGFDEETLDKLTLDNSVVNDLGLNSLTIFDFIYTVETTFMVELSEVELMKVKTLGDVVNLIYKTQRGQ